MKKILFIFIIFISTIANSNEKIITLATVNNISITNIDLKDEMLIIRALNNFKEIDKNTLQQSAFQGLVDQATKEIEIIHRLFLVIAMYCQASSSQFNESPNLTRC